MDGQENTYSYVRGPRQMTSFAINSTGPQFPRHRSALGQLAKIRDFRYAAQRAVQHLLAAANYVGRAQNLHNRHWTRNSAAPHCNAARYSARVPAQRKQRHCVARNSLRTASTHPSPVLPDSNHELIRDHYSRVIGSGGDRGAALSITTLSRCVFSRDPAYCGVHRVATRQHDDR
jgi:hypothetical protein